MPRKYLSLLLVSAAMLGGCEAVAYFLHIFAPPDPKEVVKAEYDKLGGHKVAVVVFADAKAQFEHIGIQLEISSVVSYELEQRIENLTVVSPRRIVKYQRQHIHWESMDKTQLGKALGAELILYVSLQEFATREPGSLRLYRGQLTAQVSAYKTALAENEARVWGPYEARVAHPPDRPSERRDETERTIRYKTIKIFADMVAKKFYKHEISAKS